MLSRITLLLSLLISFALYFLTLAPSVTFEDSGELITAAYVLGIPHEPGYPLFTMIAHVFTWLPFESVAWRVNLVSAFFSALAAAAMAWFTILIIEIVFENRDKEMAPAPARNKKPLLVPPPQSIKYVCAISAGILSATARTTWEQSIITEVYGLHAFFVALLLVLSAKWYLAPAENRVKYFYAACLCIGLSLTNHPTTLILAAPFIALMGFVDRKFLLNAKNLLKGAGVMLLGLTPLIYLPIASASNPVLDWGNPQTLTNFFHVITRQQYRRESWSSLDKFIPQINHSIDLLTHQWHPVLLILAAIALVVLFKKSRPLFYFFGLFILFTMPVTTILTDFDVAGDNPIINAQNKDIASVFYIPAYQAFAALIGLGIYWIASYKMLGRLRDVITPTLIFLLPLWPIYLNYQEVDKSHYYFAGDYVQNLFSVVKTNSLVITNWDPFVFTLTYGQVVENRRPDVIVLDQELLRTSWYLEWALQRYPQVFNDAEDMANHFLGEVRKFESGDRSNKAVAVDEFKRLMNRIIDHFKTGGGEVYLTFDPPDGIAEKYFKESVVAAVRLDTGIAFQDLDLSAMNFRNFSQRGVSLDPMAAFFKGYYGKLFFARGYISENTRKPKLALDMYRRALEMLDNHPDFVDQIRKRIQRLEPTSK